MNFSQAPVVAKAAKIMKDHKISDQGDLFNVKSPDLRALADQAGSPGDRCRPRFGADTESRSPAVFGKRLYFRWAGPVVEWMEDRVGR